MNNIRKKVIKVTMCWVGQNKPIIAEEDKQVVKAVVNSFGKLRSPFYLNTEWKLKEKKEIRIETFPIYINPLFEDSSCISITEGIHSFDPEIIELYKLPNQTRVIARIRPNRSKLAMTTVNFPPLKMGKYMTMNCIIPKGTLYFQNQVGQIVSEAIIPINISPL